MPTPDPTVWTDAGRAADAGPDATIASAATITISTEPRLMTFFTTLPFHPHPPKLFARDSAGDAADTRPPNE
jgi:hypothetical protein